MKQTLLVLGACAVLVVQGCTGESSFPVATGKGTIRALNMIPTSPEINFLIEERPLGSVTYKSATTGQQFDDLEFNFNFEVDFLDIGRTRVATQFLDVAADKDYTLVISGALAAPTITVWEADARNFDGSETVFEARFAHTAALAQPVDVYLAPTGTLPVFGEQAASLTFGDVSAPADFPGGEVELILTAAGDPTIELFRSNPFTPLNAASFTFAVFDGDANDLGPIAVRQINAVGQTTALAEANERPTLRFFNASTALGNVDIYDGDPLMDPPIVQSHDFGDVSGDVPVERGAVTYTYTPAGDTSMIAFEDSITAPATTHSNFFVVGDTGALQPVVAIADRRGIETAVKFSFFHASLNHALLDVYVVAAGTDIADQDPVLLGVPTGVPPVPRRLIEDDYDIYLTVAGEKTVVAGPLSVSTSNGDILNTIALDNVDPAIADLVIIPPP